MHGLPRTGGRNPSVGLVLAGVIVSSLFQALVSILEYTVDDAALWAIVFWIMGGLYYASWRDLAIRQPVMTAGTALVWSLSRRLKVLSMGDEEACSLSGTEIPISIITSIAGAPYLFFSERRPVARSPGRSRPARNRVTRPCAPQL